MKTRTDLLNFLAEKYNLSRYLEIGVQNPSQNFDKIKCEYKESVDPDLEADATYCMTSDQFFDIAPYALGYKDNKFDLIFIDGLHHADQVKKDFENALKVLSPNGFICIHDCNPDKEEHTIVPRPTKSGHWNGDVYKFAASLHGYTKNKYTVDIDNGCLVFRNISVNVSGGEVLNKLGWDYFDQNRKELLNLVSWDDFVNSHL